MTVNLEILAYLWYIFNNGNKNNCINYYRRHTGFHRLQNYTCQMEESAVQYQTSSFFKNRIHLSGISIGPVCYQFPESLPFVSTQSVNQFSPGMDRYLIRHEFPVEKT